MHLRKFSFLYILFYLSNIYIYSQEGSRSSLENERDVTLSKIQEAEKILLETEKSKKLTEDINDEMTDRRYKNKFKIIF